MSHPSSLPIHLPTSGDAVIIVAHPDDETLWCGGLILSNPGLRWRVVTLCRAGDRDRAPKFYRALEALGAEGDMSDLDDGPDQVPLEPGEVEMTVTRMLEERPYNLVITHGPLGEYTRHRRHEECCRAVAALWRAGRLHVERLWFFAYEDGGRNYVPRVSSEAGRRDPLPENIWREKDRIITEIYGFSPDSWEAQASPREEGFSCFDSAPEAARFVDQFEMKL